MSSGGFSGIRNNLRLKQNVGISSLDRDPLLRPVPWCAGVPPPWGQLPDPADDARRGVRAGAQVRPARPSPPVKTDSYAPKS